MQDAYEEHCKIVREHFCDEFWHVFSSVYEERVGVIDRVLSATRSTFIHDVKLQKRFPISVRTFQTKTQAVAGNLHTHIMHEIDIDLNDYALPVGVAPQVKFRFINPLWAWVQAVRDMLAAGNTMHFKPQTMLNGNGERMYGAGVQFGDALKYASLRTPRGYKPALFGISFDGGDSGVSNRSVYPVCVSALNFNGANPKQCGLVGFLPDLEVPACWKETEEFRDVRARITQACIAAVLDELENVSTGGFTARIGGKLCRFQPFLVAVRVDSKERKTYFGLKSDR